MSSKESDENEDEDDPVVRTITTPVSLDHHRNSPDSLPPVSLDHHRNSPDSLLCPLESPRKPLYLRVRQKGGRFFLGVRRAKATVSEK